MRENSGLIIITKTGLSGYTLNRDEPINGKVIVYLDKPYYPLNGSKMGWDKLLCKPEDLKLIGYRD